MTNTIEHFRKSYDDYNFISDEEIVNSVKLLMDRKQKVTMTSIKRVINSKIISDIVLNDDFTLIDKYIKDNIDLTNNNCIEEILKLKNFINSFNYKLSSLFYNKLTSHNSSLALLEKFSTITEEEYSYDKNLTLINEYNKGNIAARNEILINNLSLISKVLELDEVFLININDSYQDGVIIFLETLKKYDYKLGYNFSTYMCNCIYNMLRRRVYSNITPIKHPNDLNIFKKYIRKEQELWQQNEKKPTLEEVGYMLEMYPYQMQDLKCGGFTYESLEAIVDTEDEDNRYFYTKSLDEIIDQRNVAREIVKLIKQCEIQDRRLQILIERYYLDKTYAVIGESHHVTRSRIQQLEKDTLETLKSGMPKEKVGKKSKEPNKTRHFVFEGMDKEVEEKLLEKLNNKKVEPEPEIKPKTKHFVYVGNK